MISCLCSYSLISLISNLSLIVCLFCCFNCFSDHSSGFCFRCISYLFLFRLCCICCTFHAFGWYYRTSHSSCIRGCIISRNCRSDCNCCILCRNHRFGLNLSSCWNSCSCNIYKFRSNCHSGCCFYHCLRCFFCLLDTCLCKYLLEGCISSTNVYLVVNDAVNLECESYRII